MSQCFEFDQKIRLGLGHDNDLFPAPPSSSPDKNYLIAGVDEVGRGPLAGPVVAAAVILPCDARIEGLNDSKQLTERQRVYLSSEIKNVAIAFEVAVIENQVIDSINILMASLLAMRQAVAALSVKPHLVLVDGNQKPGTGFVERAIIKGDTLSASIMAASILAKVTRDQIMIEAHSRYPEYGFDGHKGYGAKTHLEALEKHGPCPLHRMTFKPIRSLFKKEQTLSF